jgi:hypothetical protein
VIDGAYLVAASLCLWSGRNYLHPAAGPYLRFLAGALCLMTLGWIGVHGWTTVSAAWSPGNPWPVVRALFALDCVPLLFTLLVAQVLWRCRSRAAPIGLLLALGATAAFAAPDALRDPRLEGSAAEIEEFADWRAAIPADANVLVVSHYYSAGFTWFTLERPSYLTVDQSSGVIFSQATAAEIRRRSEVLLPLEDPDWRLLSRRAGRGGKYDAHALPLTLERLEKICADPALDFVAAKEDVGIEALRHDRPGAFKDWNLYDCRRTAARRSGVDP